MKTKKWLLVAGLALLLVTPAFAVDDEEYEAPKDDETIEFTTGYRAADTDGALFRVAEYAYTDSTPVVGVAWSTSPYANTLIDLYIKRVADVDYDAKASFDMDRKVRVDVEATGLVHRLGHDPLNNLNAVSEIKVVNQTDNDPTAQYGINYSNLKIGSEFQHPDLSWLTWRIGVRQQRREGTRQQLASGHCTSCHVTSNTREVNQKQQEFTFGAHATTGGVDIDYEFLGRDFEDQAATVLAQYDVAYRPETPTGVPSIPNPEDVLITPFQDRVWFQDGLFPVNQVPQLRRSQHKLKARGKLNDANVVNFTLVRSDTKNNLTGLDYEYTGFRGRYTWRASEKFRLNFYGHWDQLDSSQYFVDMPTIVGNPAPTQGYPGGIGVTTFENFLNNWALPSRADPTIGPQNFNNWDRLSTMDRQKAKLGFDVFFRPGSRHVLRLGYFYRDIDRDHVALADGTGKTTSQNIKLIYNYRANRKLRWNNRLTFKMADNPYVNVDGGLRRVNTADAGFSPGPPAGAGPRGLPSLQYIEMQALRVANLGSTPNQLINFRSQITWSPSVRWSLSGNVRYRDGENDELDWTQWTQNMQAIGVNFWYAANHKFNFMLGLDSTMQETDAYVIVPVYDG